MVPGKKGNMQKNKSQNFVKHTEDITPERESVTDWNKQQQNQDKELENAVNKKRLKQVIKNIVKTIEEEYTHVESEFAQQKEQHMTARAEMPLSDQTRIGGTTWR